MNVEIEEFCTWCDTRAFGHRSFARGLKRRATHSRGDHDHQQSSRFSEFFVERCRRGAVAMVLAGFDAAISAEMQATAGGPATEVLNCHISGRRAAEPRSRHHARRSIGQHASAGAIVVSTRCPTWSHVGYRWIASILISCRVPALVAKAQKGGCSMRDAAYTSPMQRGWMSPRQPLASAQVREGPSQPVLPHRTTVAFNGAGKARFR